jgi:transcriptional regulator with PAS, ATPase and Fis domain
MRRYRNVMYNQMADITTLITGPSGTGKELAARAIGMARYIPFDPKKTVFVEDYLDSFHAVNLSALSPTLIESELFGHVRGSFTGAVQDRVGWFEDCAPTGTVFLDEIGDVDPAIQVKLLRVLQARVFQRIGDTKERSFRGKAIAATNRNLTEQMHSGQFREDLYYRLCADMIVAPSLGERLRDNPDELHTLVLFVARRLIGDEAVSLTEEAVSYIEQHIGMTYAWPGNVRELEQCVRNILIRGEYHALGKSESPERDLTRQLAEGSLTVDELIGRYCTLIYAKTGSYQETARRLGVDRRTIKTRVDLQLLESLRSRHSGEDLD